MGTSFKNSGVYNRPTSGTTELERIFKDVDENQPRPDIKKILLLLGLGTLSWISTYSGLLELIKANSGDISFTYKMAIGFAVAMLMLMIVYILDQLFSPLNWAMRTIYVTGYIFLTIISVGFGFGFYWKFLESRSEATRSAESAITEVQSALQGGQTRLEQLEATLATLTALSSQKAIEEREKGNSCPNSRPGDGPRRRLRDEDAKNFQFAGNFITKRSQTAAKDIKALNNDMVKVASRHPSTVDPVTGNRNAFLKKLNQRLDLTITRFNAFRTDPQLIAIRNNLAERSNKTIFPNGSGGTFKCPDNQLQSALRGVVHAIDELPVLRKPKITAVEGSEATIEAFRRLAATLSGVVVLKLPPSQEQLREMRKKAVRALDKKQSPVVLNNVRAGLNERDYIPLAIAIFVDFCLLLVSINRPMDRLKSLVPVMKDARDGPISGILSSFHATHFAGIREEFNLFQHVVFDWGGHYYVAVPLASNDIQAQYLSNLFVSLEGRGIVDRAMIPPAFIIRHKLKKMGSSFGDHRAFRLYKFRNGAWSNIVLDAVMGAARDVAIENANQRSAEQLPNPDSESPEKEIKKANFESLFENDNITIENGNPFGTETNAETDIKMPRLFQDKTAEQKDKSRGNGNKISRFIARKEKFKYAASPIAKAKNNHIHQPHGENNASGEFNETKNQPDSNDNKHHQNDHAPHHLNGNSHDTASILHWPHREKNGEKNEVVDELKQAHHDTAETRSSNFDKQQLDLGYEKAASQTKRTLNQDLHPEEKPKAHPKDEANKEKQQKKLEADKKPAINTENRLALSKLVADAKAEYQKEVNDQAKALQTETMNQKHQTKTNHVSNHNHKIETVDQPQGKTNNQATETPISAIEAITTVPDHISINKITNWYAGDKED